MRPLLLLSLFLAPACGDRPTAEATDPILATAGSLEFSKGEYRAYLHEMIGERHLERFVIRGLLDAEAERLGLEPDPAAIRAAVQRAWDERLRRAGGDEMAARAALLKEGRHDFEAWEEAIASAERERSTEEAICRATRIIEDSDIEEAFELQFGTGGIAIAARGVVFDSRRVAEELSRSSATPVEIEESVVRAEMERRAAQVRTEFENEGSLRAAAERYSHDGYGARRGGELSGALLDHYREELRSVPIGTFHGPAFRTSDTGSFECIVFVVEERIFTAREDVRNDLRDQLQNAPARAEERAALVRRLLEEYPIAFQ